MTFKDLELIQVLCTTLEHKGYETPTPIQMQAIPPVLEGRDILGCAQTGTGKTAAFALPILQRLSKKSDRLFSGQVRSLVVAPTRELALQVYESFSAYGQRMGMRMAVVYGGVGYTPQINKCKRGLDVLVATPGRLLDLVARDALTLSAVEILTLDEADRMLDMGFFPDIKRITAQLPKTKQTLLFSATMPDEILSFANSLLDNPVRIQVAPQSAAADNIDQRVYFIDRRDRQEVLEHVLSQEEVSRMLIFTRTKFGADKLAKKLHQNGVHTEVIHGDKSQNARQRALIKFKSGTARVLVATDVASRGIDVDNISHVVNFDLPDSPETYVHRIGRTARAGASGISVSFCDKQDRFLIRDIERLVNIKMNTVISPLKRNPASEAYDNTPKKEYNAMSYAGPKKEYKANSGGKPWQREPAGYGERKPAFQNNEKRGSYSGAKGRIERRDEKYRKSGFTSNNRNEQDHKKSDNEKKPWWVQKKMGFQR
ncbi:MAG: DEAD/DEAH box helicase [Spirochaetales bacterium]|nr:DEAD/DEAH box helicase [Spirochaetales bacterium]